MCLFIHGFKGLGWELERGHLLELKACREKGKPGGAASMSNPGVKVVEIKLYTTIATKIRDRMRLPSISISIQYST